MSAGGDVLDDLFHGCALAAYVEVAALQKGPPDCEATRRLAFALYEQALAEKNRRQVPDGSGRPPRREAGQGCAAPRGAAVPSPARQPPLPETSLEHDTRNVNL